MKANGFGGVELAWLYPSWLDEEDREALRPEWLGPEWRALVAFAKRQADDLGLGCDFTFGSCWPFGGSWVPAAHAAQTFHGLSDQRLHGSWEDPAHGPTYILNHLSSAALASYSGVLVEALQEALQGQGSALFCDSLELNTHELWSEQLWSEFQTNFGYDLRPFSDDLDEHSDVRYDYRKLISDVIRREFYSAFTATCHASGAYSRVQCHGAPTDLLQAYAAVDVPETEALLFRPSFARIAASAAAWSGKNIVSSETFTCIYGFPGRDSGAEEYWKEEQTADLKLLADAQFANGVNQIVWHGMPYQPSGREVEFYASVHVGPDSPLAPDLLAFNNYLESISSKLQLGRTYAGIGVYLPFEDALMRDHLPDEERTPGANYYWEMRHAKPAAELEGYHPLWISSGFLQEAYVDSGCVCSEDLRLQAIYVDVEWLDADSMLELQRVARKGATIIWKRLPKRPGRYQRSGEYLPPSSNFSLNQLKPLLDGRDLPLYWAREMDDDLLVFFAHPKAREISYPMPHALAVGAGGAQREILLRWKGAEASLQLDFQPSEALFLRVSPGGVTEIEAMSCVGIGRGK